MSWWRINKVRKKLLYTILFFTTISLLSTTLNQITAQNSSEGLKFLYSDISLTHACSYYEIYSKDIKKDLKTFDISKIKEIYGKLKEISIEVLLNESYNVSIPIYGTCYQLVEINSTNQTCEEIGCLYYNSSYCNCSYSCIIDYKNETRYRNVWRTYKKYSVDKGELKLKEEKEFDKEKFPKVDDWYQVRVCGNYDFEYTPNGWGVTIDHIPEFQGTVYTEFTWWNASWTYRKRLNFTEQSGNNLTNYPIIFWVNHEGHANSVCSDIRIASETSEIDAFGLRNCNSTHVELVIKVDISANSYNDTWYVYYGNNTPVNFVNSSWNDVRYNLFDDFEGSALSSIWKSYTYNGGISVSNSNLELWATGYAGGGAGVTIKPEYQSQYGIKFGIMEFNWTQPDEENYFKAILGDDTDMGTGGFLAALEHNQSAIFLETNALYGGSGVTHYRYKYWNGSEYIETDKSTESGYQKGNVSLRIYPNGTIDYKVNGILKDTALDALNMSENNEFFFVPGFAIREHGSGTLNQHTQIGWVKTYNYVDPEPTVSIGSKEVAPFKNSITLNYPTDGSTVNYLTVDFNYTPTFYIGDIVNCSLWTNETGWSLVETNSTPVQNGTQNTITHSFSSSGWYEWNVRCCNSSDCVFADSNYTLKIDLPPTWSNQGENVTEITAGEAVKLYALLSDDSELSYAWLSTNETGTWRNYTELYELADQNTGRPRDILNRLYQQFNYHYANRISGTYLSPRNYDTGIYMPYVCLLGIQIYARDHNQTVLDIAEKACEELYLNRDPTTGLLRAGTSTGGWQTTSLSNTLDFYIAMSVLALYNSTFKDYFENLVIAYDNYGYNHTTNLTYTHLNSDGTRSDDYAFPHESTGTLFGVNLFYNAYKLTGNITYLNRTAMLLDGMWKVRGGVNLIAHKYNANTGEPVVTYAKSSSGSILQMLAYLKREGLDVIYYDGNPVNITNMTKVMADAFWTYYWDGRTWDYRVDYDTGATVISYAVAMDVAIDRALLMASYALNDFSYMERSKNAILNGYDDLNTSQYGTVAHSDPNGPSDNEMRISYNLPYAETLYLFYLYDNKNDSFKIRADDIVDSLDIWKTSEGTYRDVFDVSTSTQSDIEWFDWFYIIDEQEMALRGDDSKLNKIPVGLRGWNLFDAINNSYVVVREGGPMYYGSPLELSGTSQWANFTWQNTSFSQGDVAWRIYFNDSYGNENSTNIMTFSVSALDTTPPTITFVSQTPSDLNESSTEPLSIIINITDPSGVNTSRVAFFAGINHTLTQEFYHYNWTWRYPANALQPDMRRAENRNMSYWFESVVFKENPNDIWTFAGYDNTTLPFDVISEGSDYITINITFDTAQDIFPQIFPISKKYLTSEDKTGQYISLHTNNWVKIKFYPSVFYNYTTENYTIYISFNIDPSFTPNNQPLEIYFCNSSYTTGDPLDSDYCAYVEEIDSTDTRTIVMNQSSYIQNIFYIANGYVDGIKVSDEAYIVLKTTVPAAKAFRLYYADDQINQYINFSNFNHAWLSSDNGASWTPISYTPDFYIISTQAERDKVMYYVYACDKVGNCANSSMQYDSLDPVNHAPIEPLILTPTQDEKITGLYDITWTTLGDPDFDPFNASVYLLNPDGTLNLTLADNNITGSNEQFTYSYQFNTSIVPSGVYRLNITLCDSHDLCSSSKTAYNFSVYKVYVGNVSTELSINTSPIKSVSIFRTLQDYLNVEEIAEKVYGFLIKIGQGFQAVENVKSAIVTAIKTIYTDYVRVVVKATNISLEKIYRILKQVSEFFNIIVSVLRKQIMGRELEQFVMIMEKIRRIFKGIRKVSEKIDVSSAVEKIYILGRQVMEKVTITEFAVSLKAKFKEIGLVININEVVKRTTSLKREVAQFFTIETFTERVKTIVRSLFEIIKVFISPSIAKTHTYPSVQYDIPYFTNSGTKDVKFYKVVEIDNPTSQDISFSMSITLPSGVDRWEVREGTGCTGTIKAYGTGETVTWTADSPANTKSNETICYVYEDGVTLAPLDWKGYGTGTLDKQYVYTDFVVTENVGESFVISWNITDTITGETSCYENCTGENVEADGGLNIKALAYGDWIPEELGSYIQGDAEIMKKVKWQRSIHLANQFVSDLTINVTIGVPTCYVKSSNEAWVTDPNGVNETIQMLEGMFAWIETLSSGYSGTWSVYFFTPTINVTRNETVIIAGIWYRWFEVNGTCIDIKNVKAYAPYNPDYTSIALYDNTTGLMNDVSADPEHAFFLNTSNYMAYWTIPTLPAPTSPASISKKYVLVGKAVSCTLKKRTILNAPLRTLENVLWLEEIECVNLRSIATEYSEKWRIVFEARNIKLDDVPIEKRIDEYGAFITLTGGLAPLEKEVRNLTYITDPVTAEWITSYPPDRDEFYYVDEDAEVQMNVTVRSWTALNITETITKEIPIIYGRDLKVWYEGKIYDEEDEVTGKYTLEIEGMAPNEVKNFFINFSIPTVESKLKFGIPQPRTGLMVRVYELKSITPYTLTVVHFNPPIEYNLTRKVVERETGAELPFGERDGYVDIDVGAFSVGQVKTIEIHYGRVVEIPSPLEKIRYWLFEREFYVPVISNYILYRNLKGWELLCLAFTIFIFGIVIPYYILKKKGIIKPIHLKTPITLKRRREIVIEG